MDKTGRYFLRDLILIFMKADKVRIGRADPRAEHGTKILPSSRFGFNPAERFTHYSVQWCIPAEPEIGRAEEKRARKRVVIKSDAAMQICVEMEDQSQKG